jgi:hypothetical protein
MKKIDISLTQSQCNLIAMALDMMQNSTNIAAISKRNSLSSTARADLIELFEIFDKNSDPLDKHVAPKVTGLQLVYDRDSNIRPLFPK